MFCSQYPWQNVHVCEIFRNMEHLFCHKIVLLCSSVRKCYLYLMTYRRSARLKVDLVYFVHNCYVTAVAHPHPCIEIFMWHNFGRQLAVK